MSEEKVKFDRESDRLKAKSLFTRGAIQKRKGQLLSSAEVDTLSDEAIVDMIAVEAVEIVRGEAEDDGAAEA